MYFECYGRGLSSSSKQLAGYLASACQNIISAPQPQHLIPSTHFFVRCPSFQCMHQIMPCQIAYRCLSCRHWNDNLQIPASRTDLFAFSDYICLIVSNADVRPRYVRDKRWMLTWLHVRSVTDEGMDSVRKHSEHKERKGLDKRKACLFE